MYRRQDGFAHLGVVIVALIVVVGIGFAGYTVWNAKKQNNTSKNWQYTTFEDCIDHHTEEGSDPGQVNDTCINLQNEKRASNEATLQTLPPETTTCKPEPALADAKGAFKELPFDVSNIRLVTLGKETNDVRFVYPWVKSGKVDIYAPADGVLYKIRHKVFEVGGEKGNDYDLFFQVDCGTVYRFNHISDPRADIKAVYPAGDLPSGDYANGGTDIQERVQPKTAIKVKAGEKLGSTAGVPGAKDFDFAVGVAKEAPKSGEALSVCPFSVFTEPHKTTLMNLLGPKNGSPTPGYPCDVPSQKF
ncbi:MAG TPA: hypothetical protein VJ836_01645 [Candidatus Saccharimonadales bacterium]|nr:hypothetical protein [Candidatus Saccharimonadales bacterium]